MNTYLGKCDCGATEVAISLPMELSHYAPRACDCDFCTSRQVAYLSDPQGVIEIKSRVPLHSLQQGSNQATFLSCSTCSTIMCVTYSKGSVRVGTVNATRLDDKALLQPAVSVSPQRLSPEEKTERWLALWSPLRVEN